MRRRYRYYALVVAISFTYRVIYGKRPRHQAGEQDGFARRSRDPHAKRCGGRVGMGGGGGRTGVGEWGWGGWRLELGFTLREGCVGWEKARGLVTGYLPG